MSTTVAANVLVLVGFKVNAVSSGVTPCVPKVMEAGGQVINACWTPKVLVSTALMFAKPGRLAVTRPFVSIVAMAASSEVQLKFDGLTVIGLLEASNACAVNCNV